MFEADMAEDISDNENEDMTDDLPTIGNINSDVLTDLPGPKLQLKRFDSCDHFLDLAESEKPHMPEPVMEFSGDTLDVTAEIGTGLRLLASRALLLNRPPSLPSTPRTFHDSHSSPHLHSASSPRLVLSADRASIPKLLTGKSQSAVRRPQSWAVSRDRRRGSLQHTSSLPAKSRQWKEGRSASMDASSESSATPSNPCPSPSYTAPDTPTSTTPSTASTPTSTPIPKLPLSKSLSQRSASFRSISKESSFRDQLGLSPRGGESELNPVRECLLYPTRVSIPTALSPLLRGNSQANNICGPSTVSGPRRLKDRTQSLGDDRACGWGSWSGGYPGGGGGSSGGGGVSGSNTRISWRTTPLLGFPSVGSMHRDRALSDAGSFADSFTTGTDSDQEECVGTEEDDGGDICPITGLTMKKLHLGEKHFPTPQSLSPGGGVGAGSRLLASRALHQGESPPRFARDGSGWAPAHSSMGPASASGSTTLRELTCEGISVPRRASTSSISPSATRATATGAGPRADLTDSDGSGSEADEMDRGRRGLYKGGGGGGGGQQRESGLLKKALRQRFDGAELSPGRSSPSPTSSVRVTNDTPEDPPTSDPSST